MNVQDLGKGGKLFVGKDKILLARGKCYERMDTFDEGCLQAIREIGLL